MIWWPHGDDICWLSSFGFRLLLISACAVSTDNDQTLHVMHSLGLCWFFHHTWELGAERGGCSQRDQYTNCLSSFSPVTAGDLKIPKPFCFRYCAHSQSLKSTKTISHACKGTCFQEIDFSAQSGQRTCLTLVLPKSWGGQTQSEQTDQVQYRQSAISESHLLLCHHQLMTSHNALAGF